MKYEVKLQSLSGPKIIEDGHDIEYEMILYFTEILYNYGIFYDKMNDLSTDQFIGVF